MTRQTINPDDLFNSLQYGFSQVSFAEITPGSRLVTLSGQVGWDADQQIAKGDLAAQMIAALRHVAIGLRAAGGSLDDVLTLRIYIVADVMEDSAAIRAGLQQVFPQSPPAATWIGVTRLANADFLVEVEAMALVTPGDDEKPQAT